MDVMRTGKKCVCCIGQVYFNCHNSFLSSNNEFNEVRPVDGKKYSPKMTLTTKQCLKKKDFFGENCAWSFWLNGAEVHGAIFTITFQRRKVKNILNRVSIIPSATKKGWWRGSIFCLLTFRQGSLLRLSMVQISKSPLILIAANTCWRNIQHF